MEQAVLGGWTRYPPHSRFASARSRSRSRARINPRCRAESTAATTPPSLSHALAWTSASSTLTAQSSRPRRRPDAHRAARTRPAAPAAGRLGPPIWRCRASTCRRAQLRGRPHPHQRGLIGRHGPHHAPSVRARRIGGAPSADQEIAGSLQAHPQLETHRPHPACQRPGPGSAAPPLTHVRGAISQALGPPDGLSRPDRADRRPRRPRRPPRPRRPVTSGPCAVRPAPQPRRRRRTAPVGPKSAGAVSEVDQRAK